MFSSPLHKEEGQKGLEFSSILTFTIGMEGLQNDEWSWKGEVLYGRGRFTSSASICGGKSLKTRFEARAYELRLRFTIMDQDGGLIAGCWKNIYCSRDTDRRDRGTEFAGYVSWGRVISAPPIRRWTTGRRAVSATDISALFPNFYFIFRVMKKKQ